MWLVVTPQDRALVSASTPELAKLKVLRDAGLGSKPYLMRDWLVRPASPDEILHLSVWADNVAPLADQPRRRRNPDQLRLV
jgi:hypothetical protein